LQRKKYLKKKRHRVRRGERGRRWAPNDGRTALVSTAIWSKQGSAGFVDGGKSRRVKGAGGGPRLDI